MPTLELRHPLGSPFNFYTWAEQLADFTRDVIHGDNDATGGGGRDCKMVTLVADSIGTMSFLQSMINKPDLYNGVLVVNPNFWELHLVEVLMSSLVMPIVRRVQRALRENGASLF